MFREIMKDVVLPSGVGALPQNLGESKHGRLKASDWLTLFTLILPLIIPKSFIEEIEDIPLNSKRGIFLQNTGDVIQCTRIVCSWSVKEGYAGRFKIAYNRYLKNAKTLYKNPKLKPNHHYCLHIPQQMKIWGPMLVISEFSGERVIGLLQKIPTNNKTSEIHGTIIRKTQMKQKLLALYTKIYQTSNRENEENAKKTSRLNKLVISNDRYIKILQMLKLENSAVRDYRDLPHPSGSLVLSQYVISQGISKGTKGVQVSCGKPNNCVVFVESGRVSYGLVQQVYDVSLVGEGTLECLLIRQIINQWPMGINKMDGNLSHYFNLMGVIFGELTDEIIIRGNKVTAVASYRLLAPETLGVDDNGIALVPYKSFILPHLL
ncbi:hypothetical protein O181_131434 [Austropuccinia psidii MF-1]|uniref:Uncharacterized protein n=1 Tax=Austropuccinia psidii MF-1 TaxID=1389203 RepID=A0A9Q3L2X2_9BASI|nr:hypothetical protein [Austropuccinia psidii MF-1]